MTKKKTAVEMREAIANAEKQIKQGENLIAEKMKQHSKLVRKERTHRLIERGAILESIIAEADNLTNEQIQTLLRTALSTPAVREMTAAFLTTNKALSADETPENS